MTQENNGTNWSQQVWQQPQGGQPDQPQMQQGQAQVQQGQPQSAQPQMQTGSQAQQGWVQPQPLCNSQPRAASSQAASFVHPSSYAQGPVQGSYPSTAPAGVRAQGSAPMGSAPVPPFAGAPAASTASAAAPVAQPKKRGWIVALTAVVLFFVLMFYGMHSCTSAFSSMMDPFDAMGDFSSGHGMEMTTGDTVAIIEMTGEISYDWTNCSPEGLKYQLDVAEEDPNIKAVVLRVNSGGGTATAGEEMAAYVRDFSKPIVVSSAATNASAAYEISSQTDYIFVGQTTMIGSIGTALQLTDLSGLYEKLGINIENITSADNKDATYGTRPLTDAEREHYQALVDQINDTFIQTVADGRGMTVEDVRALATGMTFSGIDAVENGLADEIGGLEDALDKAAELSDADSDYDVVYLEPDYAYDLYSLLGMKAKGDASGASGESAADALFLKEMEDGFGTR